MLGKWHTGQEGIRGRCCSDDPSSLVSDWSRSWGLSLVEPAAWPCSLVTQPHWAEQWAFCRADPRRRRRGGRPPRAGPPHSADPKRRSAVFWERGVCSSYGIYPKSKGTHHNQNHTGKTNNTNVLNKQIKTLKIPSTLFSRNSLPTLTLAIDLSTCVHAHACLCIYSTKS